MKAYLLGFLTASGLVSGVVGLDSLNAGTVIETTKRDTQEKCIDGHVLMNVKTIGKEQLCTQSEEFLGFEI